MKRQTKGLKIMDDIVKAALAKWPNVPNCYGWLGLDARGNWYMRDDKAQAAGTFQGLADAEPGRNLAAKGSLLKHDKLIDFIQRNYEADDTGQWFFQNGPQRVYVELVATPLIWRVEGTSAGPDVAAHTGAIAATVMACMTDELGRVYLQTDIGFGLIHSLDMFAAAEAVEQGVWTPTDVQAADLPQRYGYVSSPQALQNK